MPDKRSVTCGHKTKTFCVDSFYDRKAWYSSHAKGPRLIQIRQRSVNISTISIRSWSHQHALTSVTPTTSPWSSSSRHNVPSYFADYVVVMRMPCRRCGWNTPRTSTMHHVLRFFRSLFRFNRKLYRGPCVAHLNVGNSVHRQIMPAQ